MEQKLAVYSAIQLPDDYTLMVSLPTGGGKSLITQLLSAVEQKLTLVVVPTVSLAKDQYLQAISSLVDEGAKNRVFCYRADSNNDAIISGIKNKTARLIFTSPEAIIKSDRFNNELRKAATDQFLHNVVVDEAHIVPDWGVYFRPDFQIFSVVLSEMKKASGRYIRTYLLSATAFCSFFGSLITRIDSPSKRNCTNFVRMVKYNPAPINRAIRMYPYK